MAVNQDATAAAALAHHHQISYSEQGEQNNIVSEQGELASIPKSRNLETSHSSSNEREESQDCALDLPTAKVVSGPALLAAGNQILPVNNNSSNLPPPLSITRQTSSNSNSSSSNPLTYVPSRAAGYQHSSTPPNTASLRGKPPSVAVVKLNDTHSADASSSSTDIKSPISGHKKKASFELISSNGAVADTSPNKSNGVSSLIHTPVILEDIPGSPQMPSSPISITSDSFGSSHKRRQRSEREVLVGTPVKEGHVNYMLMYDMLTGIRISVSRCYAKPHREVVESDFQAAHKLAFDVTGNEMTPSSKYDFKFKDYCPWVFRLIRLEFHVDPSYYLLSLTGKYVLSELVSSGKSGSFFYYSQDYRFIIKTIHHSEHKFILKTLQLYYEHIKSNPHTLLSRIFGLHRVKLPGNKKIHFVVMGNVFPANKDIHEVFDLKGSLYGRKISDEEAMSNPRAVMKDLNWIDRKKKLLLGPQKRAIFEKQLEVDVSYLMNQGIMDYSLLIGIHDLVRGNQDHIRDQTLSVFEPNSDALSRRATAISRKTKNLIFNEEAKNDLVQLGPSSSKLPENIPPERRYCIFYSDEGGFRASSSNDLPETEIYYIGIIDICTFYSPIKRLETAFRSIGRKKVLISAVDPILYGNRFKKFMKDAIADAAVAISEDLKKKAKDILAIPSGSFLGLPN